MNRIRIVRTCRLLLTLLAVVVLGFPTLMTTSAAGPGDPDTAVIVNCPDEMGLGGYCQITVSIANAETDPVELRGVEVHLTFDPAIVEVVSVAPSAALFDGTLQIGQNQFDNVAGTIDFAVAQSGGTPVFNANAPIATITWRGLAAGETAVTVAGMMSDPEGYDIPVDTLVPGTVTVALGGCIEGFVNLQGRYSDQSPGHSGVRVVAGAYEAYTEANGYFKLEGVEAGTYEVTAEMYAYLWAEASGVEVVAGGACTDIGATKLLGGDVAPQPTPDNVIDIGDITYIASRFRGVDMTADVTGDGIMVNILDLTMAAANFGRSCPTPWSMTP